MSDKKLTQLTSLSSPALEDLLYVVDVSDTTDSVSGSSKQTSVSGLKGLVVSGLGLAAIIGLSGSLIAISGDITGLQARAIYNPSWTVISGNYTASNGEKILANTSVSGFWLRTPVTPLAGYAFYVADAAPSWSTHNLTISGSIETGVSLVCDTGVEIHLAYNATKWRVL